MNLLLDECPKEIANVASVTPGLLITKLRLAPIFSSYIVDVGLVSFSACGVAIVAEQCFHPVFINAFETEC